MRVADGMLKGCWRIARVRFVYLFVEHLVRSVPTAYQTRQALEKTLQ